MLPGAGRVAFSVSAGVPYAALAEVNLGVSNWFSLGAGAAVSDKFNEWAVFARPRFLLAHPGPVEVVLQVPVLYYPKVERRGGWDWFLANPALLVRGPVTRSTCAYLGVGAALLSTTESLSSAFRDPKAEEPPLDWDFSERPAEQRHETVNGVWNTIHLGVDQALGRNWVVGFDSLLLLKGIDIAKDYSRKVGPPFVAEAGVSYVF